MTIFALSSGKGVSGIAVIRLSGAQARSAVQALIRSVMPEPRRASVRALYGTPHDQSPDTQKDTPIDRAMVLWLPGPASFTGEDMAEFHVHGGVAVVEAVLQALAAVEGCRPAEPGEFTRRAFENGRLDLTEAEGIADLIAAETEAQRQQAVRQMDGALGEVYETWRHDLIQALAYMEAELDFVEEALPEDLIAHVLPGVQALATTIAAHLDDNHRGERLRDGFQVVILGEPNVGKSSLINALSNRDVAIVSDIAGTTRDMIEVHLNLGGYPVTLVDTAGLRDGGDVIEQEGVRRAKLRATSADLSLRLYSADNFPQTLDATVELVVASKCDLEPAALPNGVLALSTKTGEGVEALLAELEQRVIKGMEVQEAPGITRIRHRQALEQAQEELQRALDGAAINKEPELIAEDLRLASRALGRITGRVDVEDLLDVIFSDFCIGK
jgi:tRNA modification GTPase